MTLSESQKIRIAQENIKIVDIMDYITIKTNSDEKSDVEIKYYIMSTAIAIYLKLSSEGVI